MNNQEQFLAGAIPCEICTYPIPGFNYSADLAYLRVDGRIALRVDGRRLTELTPASAAVAERQLANSSAAGWFNPNYIPPFVADAKVMQQAFVPVNAATPDL